VVQQRARQPVLRLDLLRELPVDDVGRDVRVVGRDGLREAAPGRADRRAVLGQRRRRQLALVVRLVRELARVGRDLLGVLLDRAGRSARSA